MRSELRTCVGAFYATDLLRYADHMQCNEHCAVELVHEGLSNTFAKGFLLAFMYMLSLDCEDVF